jgi:MFS family permease
MAMLYRTFPPEERIRASAILTGPTTLAPALGPVLGGLLVASALSIHDADAAASIPRRPRPAAYAKHPA